MIRSLRAATAVLALAVATLATSQVVSAAPVKMEVDRSHSSVSFNVRHFFTKVTGSFDKFSADITYDPDKPGMSSVTATVDVASVNTKNEKRDGHLRSDDFFSAEKFPTMTFVSKKITWKGTAFTMTGDLTIRDVTQPVVFTGELTGYGKDSWGGTRAGFTAKATIDRTKFNVLWNKPWEGGTGAMLSNEVTIQLDVEATPAEASKS